LPLGIIILYMYCTEKLEIMRVFADKSLQI